MPGPEADAENDEDEPRLRWPTYAIVLAVVLVVALLTAWAAGSAGSDTTGAGIPGSTDAVRLGPEPGESVAGYLARIRDAPPGAPGPRAALVSFAPETDGAGAIGLLAGTGAMVREVVFRVPLERVQTALRRIPLDTTVDPATALRLAETQAANRAGETARTGTGRPAAVATVEAARLAAGCPCVLAVVVTLDPAAVAGLRAEPGVSAVQVAPPGEAALAVSPLLPEQLAAGRADPVPDDGPVPAG